jgi:hypothetical protein
MMLHIFENSFIANLKSILHDKKLLFFSLFPFLIIIFLWLVFPLLADFVYSHTGFNLNSYYTLIAITFVGIIPALIGMIYARVLYNERGFQSPGVTTVSRAGKRNAIFLRLLMPAIFSLVFVLLTMIIAKPVPTEGWLRTLFAAILLSIQTPFVFLFIITLSENRNSGWTLSGLYWIFLIVVPVGMLLHHPWNYFAFFSPLYWLAWAWIVQSPIESMIYGSIALIMTSGGIIILLHH